MRECGRRVSFLIAEKSMHQRGIGLFAKMINASKVVVVAVTVHTHIRTLEIVLTNLLLT